MNRRHFLSLLGIAAATAVIDPERLLWTPDAKTHILPPPQGWGLDLGAPSLAVGDVITIGDSPQRFKVTSVAASNVDVARLDPYFERPELKDVIAKAAKALADHIDEQAMRIYDEGQKDLRFLVGDQWASEQRRLAILRYGMS